MYVLYDGGEEVDRFNPTPDYWSEDLSAEEQARWSGDAEILVHHWPGGEPSAIVRYLVRWDLDDDDLGKAYGDDDHRHGDCWQLLDFMKKLGLASPGDPGDHEGEGYLFQVETDP